MIGNDPAMVRARASLNSCLESGGAVVGSFAYEQSRHISSRFVVLDRDS